MLKKITKLVLFSCIASSATLMADGNMGGSSNGPEIYAGGCTLGASVNTSAGSTNPFLTLGYIGDYFLFDVGFNFTNYVSNGSSHSHFNKNYGQFMGHLGLRNQLFQNVYITYGATGSVVAGDFADSVGRPYSVGAFTGLDFQATRHFLISVKINPYNYQRPSNDVHFNEVFSSSSINLAYVF